MRRLMAGNWPVHNRPRSYPAHPGRREHTFFACQTLRTCGTLSAMRRQRAGLRVARRHMATIGITNQKGGCGKTSTAINLAAGLADSGKTVLVVDLDPQAPVAPGLGVTPAEDLIRMADAVKYGRLSELVTPTTTPGLFVAPGDNSLDPAAIANQPLRDTLLQRALTPLRPRFDFILLDTPPNLDIVTLNAFMAADWLILTSEVDRESFISLNRTLEVAFEYAQFRPEIDPQYFYRVLVTIYDARELTINEWFSKNFAPLAEQSFRTRIHRATAIKKARAYGLSIFDYAQRSRLALASAGRAVADFESLTREVLAHEAQRRNSGHAAYAA
ncbi:MAG: ParA family protein [Pirellulales bacterium]|nr:ParA family protein [Pirellulales bacterium]